MEEFSIELIAKMRKTNSKEELAELLKANGYDDVVPEDLWEELEKLRVTEDKELSLDELESVAGGVKKRDWLEKGCASTVEKGSNCWGTDGGCMYINIKYYNLPDYINTCPKCGAYVVDMGKFFVLDDKGNAQDYRQRFVCRKCGEFSVRSYDF